MPKENKLMKYKTLLSDLGMSHNSLSLVMLDIISKNYNEIMGPLRDGTLDPGDAEDIAGNLVKHLNTSPAFKDYILKMKESAPQYAKLYNELGTASVEDIMGLFQASLVPLIIDNLSSQFRKAADVRDAK